MNEKHAKLLIKILNIRIKIVVNFQKYLVYLYGEIDGEG